MAATGFTPVYIYASGTTGNIPSASNLTNTTTGSEIALNYFDGKLFYKNSSNAVVTVPLLQSSASSDGWLSSTDWSTFNGKAPSFTYTSGYIPFGQGTTTPAQDSNLIWDNTNKKLAIATSAVSKVNIGYTSTAASLSDITGAALGMIGSSSVQFAIGNNPSAPYNMWAQVLRTSTSSVYPLSLQPLGGPVLIRTQTNVGNDYQLQFSNGTITQFAGYFSGSTSYVGNYSNHDYAILTNNTTKLTVSTGGDVAVAIGNVVIGTTGKGVTTGSAINLGFGTNNSSTQMTLFNSGGFSIGNTTDPGANNLSVTGNIISSGTGATTISVGTTAQRPATPTSGMIRMNSTNKEPEWYDSVNSVWVPFAQVGNSAYQVQYLVVAGGGGGGGGGGNGGGGGGGAGGFRADSGYVVTPGVSYTVTVGSGGPAGTGNLSAGTVGNNSVFDTITSTGGGGGGSGYVPATSGGSGGGGGTTQGSPYFGSGTTGQGNNGGKGYNGGNYTSGGGGGAAAVGADATSSVAGNGGNGLPSSISGSAVTYAGGGGGSYTNSGTAGTGGTGGGGNAGTPGTPTGTAGSANTGGGGGGAWGSGTPSAGSAGGSGIVIISYPGVQRATGGTITSSGGYTIHTFTTSGTFAA